MLVNRSYLSVQSLAMFLRRSVIVSATVILVIVAVRVPVSDLWQEGPTLVQPRQAFPKTLNLQPDSPSSPPRATTVVTDSPYITSVQSRLMFDKRFHNARSFPLDIREATFREAVALTFLLLGRFDRVHFLRRQFGVSAGAGKERQGQQRDVGEKLVSALRSFDHGKTSDESKVKGDNVTLKG